MYVTRQRRTLRGRMEPIAPCAFYNKNQIEEMSDDEAVRTLDYIRQAFYTYFDVMNMNVEDIQYILQLKGFEYADDFSSKKAAIKALIYFQVANMPLGHLNCEDQPYLVYQSDSSLFNNYLDGLPVPIPDSDYFEYLVNQYNLTALTCIHGLDLNMDYQGHRPMHVLYRGFKPGRLFKPDVAELDYDLVLPNPEWMNNHKCNFGFVSCSVSEQVAEGFALRNNHCCILRFEIPANIKYFDSTPHATNREGEKEIVLQRNTYFNNFQITGERTTNLGIVLIDCELHAFPVPSTDMFE